MPLLLLPSPASQRTDSFSTAQTQDSSQGSNSPTRSTCHVLRLETINMTALATAPPAASWAPPLALDKDAASTVPFG